MHQSRRNRVASCIQNLLAGVVNTVFALGRDIESTMKVKHNIKRADKLGSNSILLPELSSIYGGIARRFVTSN